MVCIEGRDGSWDCNMGDTEDKRTLIPALENSPDMCIITAQSDICCNRSDKALWEPQRSKQKARGISLAVTSVELEGEWQR